MASLGPYAGHARKIGALDRHSITRIPVMEAVDPREKLAIFVSMRGRGSSHGPGGTPGRDGLCTPPAGLAVAFEREIKLLPYRLHGVS